ncbi:hypothetical protein [Aliivibrio salmonicida]|uniref:hypothetical protein n=1 Tax=Aliivibrio salmonicida TaxID=40269 RepID=UPI003D0C3B9D
MSENKGLTVISVLASFGEISASAFTFREEEQIEALPIDCKPRNGFFDQCHAILEAQRVAERESGSVVDIVICHDNDSVFCSNVYEFLDYSTHNVRMWNTKAQAYNYKLFASPLAHRAHQFQERFGIDCKIKIRPDKRLTVFDITDDAHLAITAWSSAYSQLIAKEDSEEFRNEC